MGGIGKGQGKSMGVFKGGTEKWQHQSSSIINAFLFIAYFRAASEKSTHKHKQLKPKSRSGFTLICSVYRRG